MLALLKMLNLRAATVTMDVIDCQKNITQRALEANGRHVHVVKANHLVAGRKGKHLLKVLKIWMCLLWLLRVV